MKKFVQSIESLFRLHNRLTEKLPLVVFLATFVFGYNAVTAVVQQSNAQATPVVATTTVTMTTAVTCTIAGTFVPCTASGVASSIKSYLSSGLKENLKDSARDLENKLHDLNKDMIKAMLKRLNVTEEDMISWWKTMWDNNLVGSLQNSTNQLNASTANQSQVTQTVIDSQNTEETKLETQKNAIETQQAAKPNEKACAVATIAPGLGGKVVSIAKGMRHAWEKKSQGRGLNKKGTKGATAAAEAEAVRYDEYKTLFCDPNGNSGRNNCPPSSPADADYVNADTQPSKFIYGQTTIPVDKDHDPQGKMEKTIETEIDNLVGVTSADPISQGALSSASGQETLLDRRSYLARYAATRSVPHLVTTWRLPGSKMSEWVKGLQDGAGIPLEKISTNPSYREIVKAVAVDRFNSGHYAEGMITGEAAIEMEKLTLNAFYLMQLRDYYELLERTALVLAVQVAMMVDQAPVPNAAASEPMKQGK
jgi:hypothetical protein